MPTSMLAQEMKKKNSHDEVADLFKGQDYGETTTIRRRLKDQRVAEVRAKYEATRPQREENDPARIVMSNAYRQQYDEDRGQNFVPLVKNLVGGRYYEQRGEIVGELGQPHGLSARMSGRSGPRGSSRSPPRSARTITRPTSGSYVSEGVQVATTGSASIRGGGNDYDGEDISAPEEGCYVVPAPNVVPPEVPVLPPVPQDDSADYFGNKLSPKPSVLTPSPTTKIASRTVGCGGATVASCGGNGLFRAEPPRAPKGPPTYDYSPPKHPDAPIRDVQTTTEIQGRHAWEATRQEGNVKRLPKAGGVLGEFHPPANFQTTRRPDTASSGILPGSRLSRHGNGPRDTCKFLF